MLSVVMLNVLAPLESLASDKCLHLFDLMVRERKKGLLASYGVSPGKFIMASIIFCVKAKTTKVEYIMCMALRVGSYICLKVR
jgi:hypothetical protein